MWQPLRRWAALARRWAARALRAATLRRTAGPGRHPRGWRLSAGFLARTRQVMYQRGKAPAFVTVVRDGHGFGDHQWPRAAAAAATRAPAGDMPCFERSLAASWNLKAAAFIGGCPRPRANLSSAARLPGRGGSVTVTVATVTFSAAPASGYVVCPSQLVT